MFESIPHMLRKAPTNLAELKTRLRVRAHGRLTFKITSESIPLKLGISTTVAYKGYSCATANLRLVSSSAKFIGAFQSVC